MDKWLKHPISATPSVMNANWTKPALTFIVNLYEKEKQYKEKISNIHYI